MQQKLLSQGDFVGDVCFVKFLFVEDIGFIRLFHDRRLAAGNFTFDLEENQYPGAGDDQDFDPSWLGGTYFFFAFFCISYLSPFLVLLVLRFFFAGHDNDE